MHLSARSASLVGVTTQMDESADACVIMITCREASPVWRCRCAGRCTCVAMLRRVRSVTSRGGTCAPASRIAPNSRCETSARPRSWAPSIETRETWSTDVMPRIGDSLSRSLTGHAALRFWARAATASTDHASADDSSEHARPSITVPGCAGLKMLRTKMGMRSSMHGAIAEGWRTCRRRCTGGLRGWPGVEDVWQRVVRRIVGMKTNLGSARRAPARRKKPVRSPRHTLEIRSGKPRARAGGLQCTRHQRFSTS